MHRPRQATAHAPGDDESFLLPRPAESGEMAAVATPQHKQEIASSLYRSRGSAMATGARTRIEDGGISEGFALRAFRAHRCHARCPARTVRVRVRPHMHDGAAHSLLAQEPRTKAGGRFPTLPLTRPPRVGRTTEGARKRTRWKSGWIPSIWRFLLQSQPPRQAPEPSRRVLNTKAIVLLMQILSQDCRRLERSGGP